MHLDVCLIIVKCVLVGLDWFLPMMQFKFCTSHVHAYFMHTYPFFPISVLRLCSSSFSLSLSDRLRMAPKVCKSTQAQNPLGFESSSSDSIPPLFVRFCDGKAQQDFLEIFQERGVYPECHVVLSDFTDTPLPAVIQT